ncbi:MAG TPA: SPW repeat protein [Solirubrobacteraceae bacterium]|nr:SPW repeat protein [Solirubrobacteraceae bacterium]
MWLLSPWILGYAADHAAWVNEFLAGVLLMVLGASGIGAPLRTWPRDVRRRPTAVGGAAPFGPARADQ